MGNRIQVRIGDDWEYATDSNGRVIDVPTESSAIAVREMLFGTDSQSRVVRVSWALYYSDRPCSVVYVNPMDPASGTPKPDPRGREIVKVVERVTHWSGDWESGDRGYVTLSEDVLYDMT